MPRSTPAQLQDPVDNDGQEDKVGIRGPRFNGEPARLRLIVSSIQALAEYHGWEAWANFPREQARLFELLRVTDEIKKLINESEKEML